MPEHYPKSTVEASIFCTKCNKMTPWKVADGRRQYCIPCYEKPKAAPASNQVEKREVEQFDLFKKEGA